MELETLTALELAAKIKQRRSRCGWRVKVSLTRLRKKKTLYMHILNYMKKEVYARAKEVEKGIAGNYTGPLAGVPIAVKDNICTKGRKTTCASKILGILFRSMMQKSLNNLEKAGMIIIGKTNMDEFAMGSTTETSAYGITRNPWNQNMYRVDLPVVPVRSGSRRGFSGTWF